MTLQNTAENEKHREETTIIFNLFLKVAIMNTLVLFYKDHIRLLIKVYHSARANEPGI